MFKTLILALTVLGLPAAAGAAPMELTFQAGYSATQTTSVDVLVPWADSFAAAPGSDVKVNFFPAEAIVGIAETGAALKNGMVDLAHFAPMFAPRDIPLAYALSAPFMAKSARHGTELMWKMYDSMPEFRKELDAMGVPLALWYPGIYALGSVHAPITSPADIRGKRVITCAPSDTKLLEAWGAIPVVVSAGDAYVGLQRGMGEAIFCAIPYMKGLRVHEVARYVSPLPAQGSAMVLMMNRDVWDELTEAQRALFTASTGREFSRALAASLDGDVADAKKLFGEGGCQVVELTPEQIDAFRQAMDPALKEYWVNAVKSAGVKGDPRQVLDGLYELSASIPDPGGR